jgi:hypothetical protein
VAQSPTFQAWELLDQLDEAGRLLLPFIIINSS